MKKNYLMAVCLFLVVMSGCGNKEQSSQQAEPVKVKVMTVVSSVRNETVRFSGTVQEENGSSLSFPLMGRVKSVKVDLGSRVRRDNCWLHWMRFRCRIRIRQQRLL